jgi:cell wall-associated NlpC family hydrolase
VRVPGIRLALAAVLAACFACTATAGTRDWAGPQIAAVTRAGVLGSSPSSFAPQSPLTESALAQAIAATDALQHPPLPQPPAPQPLALFSTVGPDAVVGGLARVEIQAEGRAVDHVDFAVDGTGYGTAHDAPYELDLDTSALADGAHQLAANVWFREGGSAIAVWAVTVANASGATEADPAAPVELPIAKSSLPVPAASAPATSLPDAAHHVLYRAVAPARPVSIRKLDAALVGYLGLGGAAREIQATLARAGLRPPANTGTEAVARMLGLRLNHPASADDLELLPSQAASRAEAAYSFAQLLQLDADAADSVQHAADTFTLPELSPWQQRVLGTAVHYVGYPYVWGGTSPGPETLFGVHSVGGFDCSGFVWRVYKLTPYAGEGRLGKVLRGRTTYQMSGEVVRSKLVAAAGLQPGDVMFFGARGPRSSPAEVDHTGLYLGNGWFIQSSGEGVTLLPFDGWYERSFAWARRPLREAGLTG